MAHNPSRIALCLCYDDKADEAAQHYVDCFTASGLDARITDRLLYDENSPSREGTTLTVTILLAGQEIILLNGGPKASFTPVTSILVKCENQPEIDGLWKHLSSGGSTNQCGWLTDKFGVTWQVASDALFAMLKGSDKIRSARVMKAMMQMTKLDLALLQTAYDDG